MRATCDCREFGYEPDAQWAKLPPGVTWPEVVGIATDRDDRVYVFNRGEHPVVVFGRDGSFLHSWGEGRFVRPHGITIHEDAVWCADDNDHTVRKFTLDGALLLTLGTSGRPSDTGATSMDYRNVRRAGAPFHYPTNLAVSPNGNLYISDGYGNACVHVFSPDGRHLHSWGEPGAGPGQFHLPHGLAVDGEEIVYVADRENSRVQLFNLEGKYLSEWADVARPCQVFLWDDEVYVAELGFHAGRWPGNSYPGGDAPGGRVSVFDRAGNLLARWGGGRNPCAPGDFFAPHGVCVDSRGDLYVGEVVMSGGGNQGMVPPTCHSLQKFTRREALAR